MRENPLLNLLINIVIPVVILTKFNNNNSFNPLGVFALALAFPLLYGLYDLAKKRKYNFFSLVGLISIFLTGGIGLLQLGSKWVAFKEAGVPFIVGLIILLSVKTKHPLIHGCFVLRFLSRDANAFDIRQGLVVNYLGRHFFFDLF